MDPNLRNLKDFLTLYNNLTELCFSRCVDGLNERTLIAHENSCVNNCVNKFARFNQKMMSVYVEVQTEINKKRAEEMEQLQNQPQQQTPSGTTIPAATTSTTPANPPQGAVLS